MRQREEITFGSSGLDRDHATRADPKELQKAWINGLVLPVWRGHPLILEQEATKNLVLLPTDHPSILDVADPVYLGRSEGRAIFAADVTTLVGIDTTTGGGAFDTGRYPHPLLPEGNSFFDLRAVMAALSRREAELAATARALLEWHRTHRYCSSCGVQSTSAMGGWQRQCASCNATHFPRTDPVVIMLITHGNSVLLGRSPGWPEGMYSLLAGFVEPGETLEAAVRREVVEETGVVVGAVTYLASQPWPFPANLMLGAQGVALGRDIRLDPAELEDAVWISREEAVCVVAGTHPKIKPSRRGSIAQFILNGWLADRLD